jgi:hypothetical protein
MNIESSTNVDTKMKWIAEVMRLQKRKQVKYVSLQKLGFTVGSV